MSDKCLNIEVKLRLNHIFSHKSSLDIKRIKKRNADHAPPYETHYMIGLSRESQVNFTDFPHPTPFSGQTRLHSLLSCMVLHFQRFQIFWFRSVGELTMMQPAEVRPAAHRQLS